MPPKPDPVAALLKSGPRRVDLPAPAERERLRTAYGLSRAEVADALGVARTTVAGWETGRSEPQGPTRAAYARLLDGIAAQLGDTADSPASASAPAAPEAAAAAPPAPEAPSVPAAPPEQEGVATAPHASVPAPAEAAAPASGPDDAGALAVPEPCVLCGQPAAQQVAGFPQHLDPADCGAPVPATGTNTDTDTDTALATDTAAPALA
ncbi:helix-turn-helix transcriptional regulator, partial [Streptomyces sp. UNOC14_S4]|uniref:helix-turn-helix transcriptional regulator n=1 Tax=Streptomyces sp. UNOC14_S4 TaxID=2872340 RepID=UPI001E2C9BC5